jgi:anti-anti-sigma factor
MQIITDHMDDTVVIRFEGKPVSQEWDDATKIIVDHYGKGTRSFIINWNKAEFIDSSSLSILVHLLQIRKEDPDVEFFIVTDDPSHEKTLQIFGFDKLMDIVQTEDEALKKRKTV